MKGDRSARLAPEVIQRVVRTHFTKIRACYEKGLERNRDLRGRVAVRVVIGIDGRVLSAAAETDQTRFPDPDVERCVLSAFRELRFPSPDGAPVTIVYPILFSPD